LSQPEIFRRFSLKTLLFVSGKIYNTLKQPIRGRFLRHTTRKSKQARTILKLP